MSQTVDANAAPEKRLFVSLITRDISLVDAFLDLIDNSVNSVLEPLASKLVSADDYRKLLAGRRSFQRKKVSLQVNDKEISIRDKAAGIQFEVARTRVFAFGPPDGPSDGSDRLSVYGIGMKRALFKMGDHVTISSDHVDGGFDLDLRVSKWAQTNEQPWTIAISSRGRTESNRTGTTIKVDHLFPEVRKRISDGLFIDQLRKKIAVTYAFYIGRLVDIDLNGTAVEGVSFELGKNASLDHFSRNGVSTSITAGIAVPDKAGRFRHETSGWYVFCNGRTVVYADKSETTGWTGGAGMPLFQPKHRPFLGIVLFVAEDPERLPWTTTKSAINEESALWQEARRRMLVVGKTITKYLDSRYSNDGNDDERQELVDVGGKATGALDLAARKSARFKTPSKLKKKRTIRIQYDAKTEEVQRIAAHLRKPSMGGAEVGRYTFDYFLRNKVRDG